MVLSFRRSCSTALLDAFGRVQKRHFFSPTDEVDGMEFLLAGRVDDYEFDTNSLLSLYRESVPKNRPQLTKLELEKKASSLAYWVQLIDFFEL